jgi:hypothetical protein
VWFEKIKNSLNLKFKPCNISCTGQKFKPYNISCTGQTHKDFIQASKIRSEVLFRHCSCYSDTRCVTTLPLTEISSRDMEGVVALTDTVNNYTIPQYGKTKSGWREQRKSSLSQFASFSEWWLHCILKNLIVLHLVTRSF